jgi:signal transducer and activator of transcription 5B
MAIGQNIACPTVTASIISEAQVIQMQSFNKFTGNSGEITVNSEIMKFNELTKEMTASFHNMQLKRIRRTDKKTTDGSVMDEKFALLFQTNIVIGHDLMLNVWALSLPVVVIVHGNQEPQSLATITWDNAFAPANRQGFVVPEKVLWSQLAKILDAKFLAENHRGLTPENLHFLCEKIFKRTFTTPIPDNLEVTWQQFCKDILPNNFTFWEWFYAALKLTRDHLRGIWKNGFICGFMEKSTAESVLLSTNAGTFILRFSCSGLGE